MHADEFTKDWDKENGYTMAEAIQKLFKEKDAYGVGTPDSKWGPAFIVPDHNKKSGYKIVIRTIA